MLGGAAAAATSDLIGVISFYRTRSTTIHRKADRAGDDTSPIRPSSPSRTCGCSTNCANALPISPNRWSSRRRRRRSSRSSAARRSICRRCSTRWRKSRSRLCGADTRLHLPLRRRAAADGASRINSTPEFVEWVARASDQARPAQRARPRAALERRTIHIPDVLSRPGIYLSAPQDVERDPHGSRGADPAKATTCWA